MAEVESATVDFGDKKKKKKNVAFETEGTMNGEGDKSTAEQHSMPSSADPAVDEVTEMFAGLKKKKKPSSSSKKGADGEVPTPDETSTPVEGESFDPTMLKKKKKKTKPSGAEDSFDKKLAKAGVLPTGEEEAPKEEKIDPEQALNDLQDGTGIWKHDETKAIPYDLLLLRFFHDLREQHPDLAGDGRTRSYRIPPPQVLREGNKKTIFANLPDICKRMKRTPDHVIQFLFAELGTSGSVDGSGRLVIKGRFQQKQLENVLKRYIMEYVTCNTCKSADTVLGKENRLYFVTCNSCGSRRSVSAVKTGFQAMVGKRRRMQQG